MVGLIVLDASVVIAHLDPGDPHHRAATELLADAEVGKLVIHPLTLAEVLVGGVRMGTGAGMREDIRAMGIIVAPLDEDHPLRLAELRVTANLKLPGCCVLDLAMHRQGTLATFDAHLAEAASERRVVVLP